MHEVTRSIAIPPGWDASPSQVMSQHFIKFPRQFAGTHVYSWVERGTVRVKCLAQEHTTMTWPGPEPGPLNPESSVLVIRHLRISLLEKILVTTSVLANEFLYVAWLLMLPRISADM